MASRQSWKNERKSPSRYGNRLKTDILSYFQLWRLAILEPVGVQRHNIPHFKGLIVLYLYLRSSRAWHHFYYWPRPLEKSHFIPINGVCTVCFFHHCTSWRPAERLLTVWSPFVCETLFIRDNIFGLDIQPKGVWHSYVLELMKYSIHR